MRKPIKELIVETSRAIYKLSWFAVGWYGDRFKVELIENKWIEFKN